MNLVVCGSRTFDDYKTLAEALDRITEKFQSDRLVVFVGDSRGTDALCRKWCFERLVTYRVFHADWNKHGKAAGPRRNAEMVEQAGPKAVVVAFWDGESPGTANTLDCARKRGIKTKIIIF